MGTITLSNFRVGGTVRANVRLKDGGVYVEWGSLTEIKAWLYSEEQKAIAGRFEVEVDPQDGTRLKCVYSAQKPQYLGVNKIIVQAKYDGQAKAYDKPLLNFVRWTAGQAGEQITMDDPEVDVEIVAEDISSSILDEATAAALAAAAHAEHAASLVPLQVLQDCEAATAVALTAASKAPVIGENGHWWVWSSQQAAYVDTGKQAKGDTGNGIASFSVVESEEDDADNVVTVVFTDGTTETFNVKNGKTGNGIASIVQTVESPDDAGKNVITVTMTNGTVITFNVKNGSKGQPGAAQAAYKSVETLPTASAETMDKIYLTPSGTAGVYNMSYTDYDGSAYSWVDLGTSAIQLSDYATKTEVGELQAKTENFTHSKNLADKATEVDGYVASNGTFTAASSGEKSVKFPCSPSTTYTISKVQTSRFRVAYYSTNPSAGTSGGGVITDHTASSITITTAADSAYIVVYVYNGSSETVSFSDIMASLQIEVGETATPYVKPGWVANDEIARESVASLKEETFDLIAVGDKRNSTSNQTGGIVYSTGARGTSSNFTNYYIPNDGYTKVRLYATQAGTETDTATIAFYNTATIGTSGYISGVAFRGQAGFAWYEANVPNGCVMIAVSNRDALNPAFKVLLYKDLTYLAKQVDANTLVSQSVAEKKTPTSLPIALKNCNLMGGLKTSGEYTGDYNIVSHPIRVVPGSTVSFAYTSFDVDGTTTSPLVRVAFYATKEMDSYVSTGQSTYGSPASLVVPSGANYMKVSIGLGVSKYCRNYYVDGAVTISFSEGYPYDFAQEFSDVKAELGARCLEIRRADVRTGHFNDGAVVKNSTRISTKEPYKIPEGVTSIVMTRPTNDIFLVQYTWLDANFGFLPASRIDNYERTEVPAGAKYCYISIQKNGASYKVEDMGGDSFFFNLSVVGAFSDDGSIIKQNGKVETAVKLQQVKQPAKLNGAKQTVPLSILFFSDIHGDAENLARIVRFFDYWNATRQDGVWIDAILSGGDNVQTYQAQDAFDYWANVPGAENILQTVGNHDAAANAQLGEYADKKDVYDIEFAPFISDWGVTQPENADTLGLMYYYKDFATQKIRLVVLDCMYWTADQLTWFEGVLADAKTNGYSVVGCVHYPIGYTTPIDCNFLSMDYNPTGGARLLNPIDAVDSFIANGGKFICWLSGHTHADGFGTVTDHAGQINIIIDTARSGNSAAQDAASVVGSRSQDCFNIIGFDTYSKLIKVVRIGRDYDRHLRHIGEMCVDYENVVVLYTR